MQIITPQQGETTMRESRSQTIRSIGEQKVRELVVEKRRLVEVPYTATLADTMNTLVANRVMAVPVAAPPGHWIGAGGSMITETDKHTGAVRKHYIGMVTMLDILAHLAEDDNDVVNGGDSSNNNNDVDKKLGVTVSTIIGHCLEGLSLWTLNPNTSLLDCMEVFSKGIHRAMVPLDSNMDNISGVELVESSSCYRMLTQMDVIKYLKSHAQHELRDVMARTVRSTGSVTDTILAVTHRTRAIDAIKCLRSASLQAVPIVDASDVPTEGDNQLINGYGMKIVGTFSATDIRGCPVDLMQSWLPLNVREFMAKVYRNPSHGVPDLVNSPKLLVSCYADSSLLEVIDKVTTKHVHRVWVLDEYNYGTILGVISLTDVIRAVRAALISAS